MTTPPSSVSSATSPGTASPGTASPGVKTEDARRRTDFRIALAVCAVAFVLFAACIPRITTFLDPVTGDEPFYLMTAYSILHDGDIDETNNFIHRSRLRQTGKAGQSRQIYRRTPRTHSEPGCTQSMASASQRSFSCRSHWAGASAWCCCTT